FYAIACQAHQDTEYERCEIDSDGVCGLGFCYDEGKGVEKNLEKALEYYGKAESMGSAIAKEILEKDRDARSQAWTKFVESRFTDKHSTSFRR
ncbi:4442_t:CDS:2, partial [Dentiscutata erythropus]